MACSRRATQPQSDGLPELLARVSRGDARAFSALHMITRGRLRRTALAVGVPPHDIEDVLQESYLKIWRNASRFNAERAPAMAWISAIVRNTAIDHLRVRRLPTDAFDEALSIAAAENPSASDELDYARAEPIAFGALARLPEDRRALVALAYLEGESRANLSRRFGVPVGTIKTWLHRALLTVRKDCLAASGTA
ncbi:RNA polymerase sigma factor [Bradyrhizobium guangdongense]|uniref:RNA polymerase sigma factor n=1 Tax=Bradyrhizobium guangdongense TaxID=1325090 RepID=A0A410UZY6_9BRAD|nr:sigma-70 family RNA polymerase sigma factor [Bradyrhizobium guangdongense]QAU36984.1 sigma-70 family RNA polymerase sigma factor [Bradyrhizobium guangdongense]QOZ58037.1 sigma-70 family RNA polymerase sigma factor [Bradyrhizobium guangdongense]GGI31054.1 RNA polymerase sigma factor [Bradyrhizobium guangdongense]